MRARQNGGLVYVRDDRGRVASVHNAVRLAMELLQLGDERFTQRYGFRWVPTPTTRDEAARRMERAV